jgi:hypothetical protein
LSRHTIQLVRPGEPVPVVASHGSPPRADRSSRRRLVTGALVAAAVLVLAAVGAVALLARWPGTNPPVAETGDRQSSPTDQTPPSGAPATTAARPDLAPPVSLTVVETSGYVSHAGRRYRVGEPGEETSVADFRCNGATTAVTLRPTTGEVFAFDSWAEGADELTARVIAKAPPGSHLEPSTIDAKGCAPLRVQRPDGSAMNVTIPPEAPATTKSTRRPRATTAGPATSTATTTDADPSSGRTSATENAAEPHPTDPDPRGRLS